MTEQAVPILELATTVTPEPRFTIEPWSEFNLNSQAELEFLIDGLWPEKSFVFIASPPKKGKTWLALTAAIAIATGKQFIATFDVTQPRKVLYLALEGARPALRARIGAIARGLQIDPDSDQLENLHISYRPRGINLADEAWANEIADLAANNNYALVVVDVLRNAANIKEQDQAEFSRLRRLLEPALAHTSIALLHHFAKLSEQLKERTPGERMSGSGAMYGALDVGLFITGSEQHARKLRIDFEGRDIAMPDPLSVYLEGDGQGPNHSLTYNDTAFWRGDISEIEEDNVKAPVAKVAEYVRANGGEVLMKDVAGHFEVTDDTLRDRRQSLERIGIDWVKRWSEGRNRIFLIDRALTISTTESVPHPNSVLGRETAQTSGSHSRTRPHPNGGFGSGKSADMQGDSTPDHYRSPTEIPAFACDSAVNSGHDDDPGLDDLVYLDSIAPDHDEQEPPSTADIDWPTP